MLTPGLAPSGEGVLRRRRMSLAREAPPLASPSLRHFGHVTLDQGAAGACFAFACAYAIERYYAANGVVAAPLISPGALYYPARRQEWAGADPETVPALEDTGTYPDLGMQALHGVGFVPWSVYPYPTNEDTLYDPERMAAHVNAQPPPSVFAMGYDQKGLEWGVIRESGSARIEAVEDALRHRLPVIFGAQVDDAFMRDPSALVQRLDERRLVGGHMLCADHVEPNGEVHGPNSWGAIARRFRFARDVFGSDLVSDVIVIKAAPLMRVAT